MSTAAVAPLTADLRVATLREQWQAIPQPHPGDRLSASSDDLAS